ncbi:MAG TPA: hypothetical protein VKA38_13935, partial [Draconibacterium sp.]|nr:hypothetical protein [Draconibacterium sp.]
ESLNYVEFFHFLIFLIDSCSLEKNPTKLEAIAMVLEEMELAESQVQVLEEVIKLVKFTFIISSKQNL